MIRFVAGLAVFLLLAGNITCAAAGDNIYAPPYVAKDLVQAYAWLDIAARQGLQKAAGKRDLIARETSRPQFYAAQRLKRDWLQTDGIIAK